MRRRQSEWLIALTQTEIMFILASVILILLLAQQADFKAERAALIKEQAERMADLAESEDAAEEINQTLARAGLIANSGENDKAAVGAVRKLVEEKQELNRVLRRAARQEDGAPQTAAQIKQLQAAAAQATRDLANAREQIAAMKQEMENLRKQSAQGGESTAALRRQVRAQQSEISRLRVGFTPCWPREGASPPYYFAYRIIFDKARRAFRVTPHAHLQSAAPPIAEALRGGLSFLKSPPGGWLSRAQFAAFGKKASAAKTRLYGEECRLAAQINDAGQDAIEFIRDQTAFFPVYE
jgi:hypothetical protein